MTEEQFYYALSLKSYEYIKNTYDSLEEKNTKILTAILTILPIIAGLGYFLFENNAQGVPIFCYLFSIYLFILAVILSTFCAFPKRSLFIDSLLFYEEYFGENLENLQEQASVNIGSIVQHMAGNVNVKAFYIKCELILFTLGVLMLSFSIMFTII